MHTLHHIGTKEHRAILRLKATFLCEVDPVGFGYHLCLKAASSGAED